MIKSSNINKLLMALIIIMGGISIALMKNGDPDIHCQSRTNIHEGDILLNVTAILHMNHDDNFFELYMEYSRPPELMQKFHRVVNFSYDRDGDVYKLFSDVTNDNALPQTVRSELNDLIADFFLMPQRGLKLKIEKMKNGKVIIINDKLPVFICMPVYN